VIFAFLESRHSGISEVSDSSTPQPAEPTAAETHRTVIRSARFTPAEWTMVQERAAAVGLSPSRYLRFVSLGTPLGRRINAEAVLALNRAGVNLNNLVKVAIRSGQPLVGAEVAAVLEQLRDRLKDLL